MEETKKKSLQVDVNLLEKDEWSTKEIIKIIINLLIAFGAIGSLVYLGVQTREMGNQNAAIWYSQRPLIKASAFLSKNITTYKELDTISVEGVSFQEIGYSLINLGQSPGVIDSIFIHVLYDDSVMFGDSLLSDTEIMPTDSLIMRMVLPLIEDRLNFIYLRINYDWVSSKNPIDSFVYKRYLSVEKNNELWSVGIVPSESIVDRSKKAKSIQISKFFSSEQKN